MRRARDYVERKVAGRPLNAEERRVLLRVVTFLAIPLALVSLIPSLVAVGFARVEAADRSEAIQQNRAELTLESCRDQNQRNANTVAVFDGLIAEAAANGQETRAADLRQTRNFTVLVLKALAPVQECEQAVLERFGFVPENT